MNRIGTWLAIATCLTTVGCGLANEEETTSKTSAIYESTGVPEGFVCGLAYVHQAYNCCGGTDTAYVQWHGTCEGTDGVVVNDVVTTDLWVGNAWNEHPATGYAVQADGDQGCPGGAGYYHQYSNVVNGTPSTKYLLPQGTACGFKESCNNSTNITCMGMDPVVSCPLGWTRRSAVDNSGGGRSGCTWNWCEYSGILGQGVHGR